MKVSLCLNCFLFKNFLHNFNASISQQMARRAGKGDGGRGGRFAAMAVIGGRGDLGKYVGKGKLCLIDIVILWFDGGRISGT